MAASKNEKLLGKLGSFLNFSLIKGVPVRPTVQPQRRQPPAAATAPAARLEEVKPGRGWVPPVLDVNEVHVADLAELVDRNVGDLAVRGYTVIHPGASEIDIADIIGNISGGGGGGDGGENEGKGGLGTTPARDDPGNFAEGGSFPFWLLLLAILTVALLGWAGNSAWLTIPANVWFGMLLIAVALMFWFGFSRATYTLRAGLASAIFVVFLGVLLFPTAFTDEIDADMRKELVNAFQLVMAFYFGTEGAVQAVKAWRGGAGSGGDLDNNPTAPAAGAGAGAGGGTATGG